MLGTTGRRPGTWLNVLAGVLAVGIWTSNALRAAFGDENLSTRTLFIYLSLVMVGVALAALLNVLTASGRARWRERHGEPRTVVDLKTQQFLTALWALGFGASPVLDTAPGALRWTLLAVGSLVGGFSLGAASALASERRQAAPGRVQPPARQD
jgi:hypothetical protein